MNTIQEKWESFKILVIPNDAPRIQIKEMRNAFFAGAISVISITDAISEVNVSEDAGVAMLEGLHDECRRFVNETATSPEA
jgi:hypothetical protein